MAAVTPATADWRQRGRYALWFVDGCMAIAAISLGAKDIQSNEAVPNIIREHTGMYIATGVFFLVTFILELSQIQISPTAPSLGAVKMGILGFLSLLWLGSFIFATARFVVPESPTFTQTNVLGLFGGTLIVAILTLLFLQPENPIVYFLLATAVLSAAVLSIDTTIVRMRCYADK